VAVTVTRARLRGEVVVTAEVPDGVTVEPITTAGAPAAPAADPGADRARVGASATLKLTAKAGPLSVPIRVLVG
jgi:hypothetical protein